MASLITARCAQLWAVFAEPDWQFRQFSGSSCVAQATERAIAVLHSSASIEFRQSQAHGKADTPLCARPSEILPAELLGIGCR